MSKSAAIYCRVSTPGQASEEKYSIPLQRDSAINFCKARGWIVREIYIDAGFSGKNLNRPAMQKLISEIKNFNIVVVFALSRLSRSLKDTATLIEDIFQKNSVDLVSLKASSSD